MPPSPSAGTRKRRSAEGFGRRSETLALWYLRLKGYWMLAQRYRTPSGEIDLVMRWGRTIVFVEVKSRQRKEEFALALEQVNRIRIGRAAQHYVSRHRRAKGLDQRFDVIFLAPWAWPRHVKNAF